MLNIESILADECGLQKSQPVVVGVSGGPDSLCLMELMRRAGYRLIVGCFNHQLRAEAAEEIEMVEKTAAQWNLICVAGSGDARAYADERKLSVEEAARLLRYRFLFDLARRYKAQAVAVGHTADDQVETILMHFLRGSGLAGLKGMSYRSIVKSFDSRIPITRPLLDARREETILFCSVNGLNPRYDSSNDSLNFQRNRIRHLLIPSLETYNVKFRDAVLRMSQALKGDYAFMTEQLEEAWKRTLISASDEVVTFDSSLLAAAPLGLQRNLMRHAMQTLHPEIDADYQTLKRASEFINAEDDSVKQMDLKSGLRLFRDANQIHVCALNAQLPIDRWPQMESESAILKLDDEIALSGGWKMVCERWNYPRLALKQAEENEDPFQVWLDAEDLSGDFEVRIRRAGDVFSPLGMEGHSQKISDFFINEKLPRRARDRWPLLCAGDEIIWAPGFRPAHSRRLKETTRRVVYFAVQRPLDAMPKEENLRP
ncbi:MAG: tRNA lysidine(34) synthetase TilS [Anaerolineales bacterium]|nr:tRNA lysidine(34) synthetase TilS [Anaerolineales bacterium]